MFRIYSCGCIGIADYAENCRVVKACDADTDYQPTIGTRYRGMDNKTSAELGIVETEALLDELSSLVVDGHKYRDIKRLLR